MNKLNFNGHKIKILTAKKLLQHCFTATLPFCLAGCMGVYEGGFECPPGEGVGCKSISEVNGMVDHCSNVAELQSAEGALKHQKNPVCEAVSESIADRIWYAPSRSIQCSSVQCSRDQCTSEAEIEFTSKEKRRMKVLDAQESI